MKPVKQIPSFKILINLLRLVFGGVLIFSGIVKLFDITNFTSSLSDFNLLPAQTILFFAYLIPLLELILGLLIFVNYRTAVASQVASFLIALFTAVVISKITEGANISCGCFGNLIEDKINHSTVVRNILLILIGITLSSFYEIRK